MFPPWRWYHHNLRSKDGLTILANWLEIVAILVLYQPFYNTTHRMKPSDPLLLPDVPLRCGIHSAGKVDISWHLVTTGSPRVTVLSASPVRTLVHCEVKHSRPSDLKSSSTVSLPFAWITDPRKGTQLCPFGSDGPVCYMYVGKNPDEIVRKKESEHFKTVARFVF